MMCWRSKFVIVKVADPTIRIPLGCRSYKCDTCRQPKVRERVRVMCWGLSHVDWIRHWTLTLIPPPWQRAREQVKDLLRRVRKGYKIEAAWAIEENPAGTGYHCHAMTHGEYIPHHRMMELWGGRICYVTPIEVKDGTYVAKCYEVAGYNAKDLANQMEINGGRAIHMSRGFLHGFTSREVLHIMGTQEIWKVAPIRRDDLEKAGMKGEELELMLKRLNQSV